MRLFCAIFFVVGFLSFADAAETNAVALIFRQYDQTNTSKILDHFFEMMDSMPASKTPPPPGRLVMAFHLFPDGHIGDIKVESTTVDEARVKICKKAIMDLSPLAPWSQAIRQAYTNDLRVVHFTFDFR
jgi:hypothetical protein